MNMEAQEALETTPSPGIYLHEAKGSKYTTVVYDFLPVDWLGWRISSAGLDHVAELMRECVGAGRTRKHRDHKMPIAQIGSFYGWLDVKKEYAPTFAKDLRQVFDRNLERGHDKDRKSVSERSS